MTILSLLSLLRRAPRALEGGPCERQQLLGVGREDSEYGYLCSQCSSVCGTSLHCGHVGSAAGSSRWSNGCGAVVSSKLSRWAACHRFSELEVLAAPPPSLVGCSTAAPPHSVDLCLAVRAFAGEGPGASAAVAESCCVRELLTRWPWAPVRGALPPVWQV